MDVEAVAIFCLRLPKTTPVSSVPFTIEPSIGYVRAEDQGSSNSTRGNESCEHKSQTVHW